MKRMTSRLAVILILGLMGCSKQPAASTQPAATPTPPVSIKVSRAASPMNRDHILDGDFTMIKTTKAIPEHCKLAFTALAKETQFEMADPGQEFQATDVITEKGLPARRLIFAGISRDRCFIYFEKGGIAYFHSIVVFDTSVQNEVKFLWSGTGPGVKMIPDLQQLRSSISKGEFDDESSFW